MELKEIVETNKRILFWNWFEQKKTKPNAAERLCNFITYLSGGIRLAGPQHLSKEYEAMEKKYGSDNIDLLLHELARLGTFKPYTEKLDMLVDIFNRCCEFEYKWHPDGYTGFVEPDRVVGRVPKKIMDIIDKEYEKYQEEDEKEYSRIIKEYDKALKENKSKDKIKPGIVAEKEIDKICEDLTK